jgi:hypothetical protein
LTFKGKLQVSKSGTDKALSSKRFIITFRTHF